MRGARFLGWDAPVDLAALLEAETGLPTTIDNDVNAFTVAEHWFGAGRDTDDFVVVTIGAGVGVGLVARDELVTGRQGAAGMVGPVLVLDGRKAEDVLTGVILIERISAALGRPLTMEDLPSLPDLAEDDPTLAALLDEVADAVGQLAGTVAAITAPEVVLVAGEGAPLLGGRGGASAPRWPAMCPDHLPAPEVVVDVVGDDEWARGAAALAIRAHMGVGRRLSGAPRQAVRSRARSSGMTIRARVPSAPGRVTTPNVPSRSATSVVTIDRPSEREDSSEKSSGSGAPSFSTSTRS